MIYPFFRRLLRKFMDTPMMTRFSQSRTKSSQRADEAGQFHTHPTGSSVSRSKDKNKFTGGRSLYPLTTLGGTLAGSEERIINKEGDQAENVNRISGSNGGGKGIMVVTETIVQDHARRGQEGELQKSHWPLHEH